MLGLVHEDVGCSLGAIRITRHVAGTCTGDGGASSAAAGVRGAVRFHRVKFCEPRDSAFSRRQAASAAAKCAVSPCPDAQGLSLSLTLTLNLTLNLALISRAALRTEASSRGGCSSSCTSSCGRRADH